MQPDFDKSFYRSFDNGKLLRYDTVIQKKRKFVRKLACKNILKRTEPTAVIHPEISNFMATTASISNVSFLDENNTILSSDSSGKIFIHRLESNNGDKLLEIPALTASPLKLFPLRQGLEDASTYLSQSFCVGLPNGDYFIYSTDEQRWSSRYSSRLAPYEGKSGSFHGFRFRGSRRRYHRNFEQPLWDATVSAQHLLEIADWETKPWMVRPNTDTGLSEGNFIPDSISPPIQSLWDFREVGSLLMAAFVDNERDCFTIMDHRISERPVIFCNYCPNSYSSRQDVTAACFVSDNCVATSHRWETAPSTAKSKNSLKLWDIRMVSKERKKGVLASFPLDNFCSNEPGSEWYISGTKETKTVPPSPNLEGSDSTYIRQISSTKQSNNIVITLQDNFEKGSNQTLLFDPVREKILYHHIIDDANTKTNQKDSPLIAVSEDQNYIAVCETLDYGKTKLSLHNPALKGKQRRKRNIDSEIPPPTLVGTLFPKVEDADGIRTRATSLTWNYSSTSLCFGSADGDIFLWDGRQNDFLT